MPVLPVDLYRQIVEDSNGDKNVLRTLCLTSRRFYLEVSRALYEALQLRDRTWTRLAVNSINSNHRLAQLIQHFALCTSSRFYDLSGLIEPLVNAIQLMINLRRLEIDPIWAPHPFEYPTGHRVVAAWTRSLRIPQISTLITNSTHTEPIGTLFAEFPCPLMRLETRQPLNISYLRGIITVCCERVYGRSAEPLRELRQLELRNLDTYPYNNPDWAPTLRRS